PFSDTSSDSVELEPVAPPASEPAPAHEPSFDEAATIIQPAPPMAVSSEPKGPVEPWSPPPTPEPTWQDQPIDTNKFQPAVGRGTGTNNTLGIVSLVLALLSFVCLGVLGSIPAIILGVMQRKKAKSNPAEYGGEGIAMAGIIIGVI